MNNKLTSLLLITLLATQFIILFSMFPQTTLEQSDDMLNPRVISNYNNAEIDLDNVEWESNRFPNSGFEVWSNDHNPSGWSATRSYDKFAWYATSPWPVNESSRSMGMQVRAMDPDHPSDQRVNQQSQPSWDNPANSTLTFDWYIDELPSPDDSDYFNVEIKMGNNYLHYYLGSTRTLTNSSYYAYYMIDGPIDTWNVFSRNLTSDYFDVFGELPTDFRTMYFNLKSYSFDYARVFVDDLWLINGTDVKIGGSTNYGNFELGGSGTYWYTYSPTDPGDISKSTTRVEGDYSINSTVISNGNTSYTDLQSSIRRRSSVLNKGQLSFKWQVEEWVNPDVLTYSYVEVSCENSSEGWSIYYLLCADDVNALGLGYSGDVILLADGFNTTGQWNSFNQTIWDDLNANRTVDDFWIDNIEFYTYAKNVDSRLTVLLDDAKFTSASLNLMGFEDQRDVGLPVHGIGNDYQPSPYLDVTNFAYAGEKAGNFTIADDNIEYLEHSLGDIPFNNTTEMVLDLHWYLEEFNETSEDILYVSIYFDIGTISYILANGSEVDVLNWVDDEFFIIPETNSEGSWFNLKRSLFDDYREKFGVEPDTTITTFELVAGVALDSSLTVFVDDMYLYEDNNAPEITDVTQSIAIPEVGDAVVISANVTDSSLNTTLLHYRLDSGSWIITTMILLSGDEYEATIPDQVWNTNVEYFVTANDTFGSTTTALDGTEYFEYTVGDTAAPSVTIDAPSNGSTVSGTVQIEVSVIESGSGIASLNISIDGVIVANNTDSPWTYSWNTTAFANGTHAILVEVLDEAGNIGQSLHIVTVENAASTSPPPTTTPTNPPPPEIDITVLLIIIGVIGAIVVVVVIIFLNKKKS